jgi:hypothetical protein
MSSLVRGDSPSLCEALSSQSGQPSNHIGVGHLMRGRTYGLDRLNQSVKRALVSLPETFFAMSGTILELPSVSVPPTENPAKALAVIHPEVEPFVIPDELLGFPKKTICLFF